MTQMLGTELCLHAGPHVVWNGWFMLRRGCHPSYLLCQSPKAGLWAHTAMHLLVCLEDQTFLLHRCCEMFFPIVCTWVLSAEPDGSFQKEQFSSSSFVPSPHCWPSSRHPLTDRLTRRDVCLWWCFLSRADPATLSPQALSGSQVGCTAYHPR